MNLVNGVWYLALWCLLHSMDSWADTRLIVADGTLTEIVYALGAEADLVGVDTTSTYPPAATQLPQVGYLRQLGAEGLLSLRPQRALVSDDAGPPAVLERLRAAGVAVTVISAPNTIAGVGQRIRAVGVAINKEEAAEQLAQKTVMAAQQARARVPANRLPRVLFLMDAGRRGLQAAGTDTRAAALLQLLGATNVLTHTGYRPISAEAVMTAKPQWILIGQMDAKAKPNLPPALSAGAKAVGANIEPLVLTRALSFGPRLPEVLQELIQLLYADSAAAPQ